MRVVGTSGATFRSDVNWLAKCDLPTPESPIRITKKISEKKPLTFRYDFEIKLLCFANINLFLYNIDFNMFRFFLVRMVFTSHFRA
jgi:hypothetical protein